MNRFFLKLRSKQRVLVSILLSLLIVISYTTINDSGLIHQATKRLTQLKSHLLSLQSKPNNNEEVILPDISLTQTPKTMISDTPKLPTLIPTTSGTGSNIPILVPTNTYKTPTPTKSPMEQEIRPGVFSFTDPATNLVHLRVEQETKLVPVTITLSNGTIVTGYDFK